jgi:hypothetical protein
MLWRERRRSSSRRLATDFSRPSRLLSRMTGAASVMMVANTTMAMNAVRMFEGLVRASTMFMRPSPQNLKLIILRITKMPMLIQMTAASSIRWPRGSVKSGFM